MPANQILPFASGTGANALSYSAYSALANLIAQGFQNGIADPSVFNALMRQLSVPTSAVAQFTADNQPLDVLDDGSVGNFEAKFRSALGNVILALIPTVARPQAKANQTFYVSTTGSDTNSGTQALPFLTPGRAIQAAQGYDYAGQYTATIQFANGTYSGAGIGMSGSLIGSPSQLSFVGNPTTPANVVLNTTAPLSGASGNPHCFNTVNGASINLNGFTLQSANGNALYAQGTGSIIGWQNCIFGACLNGQHMAAVLGGEVIIGASNVYTVVGAAQAHLYTDGSGSNIVNNGGALNVTVSGTPAFSLAFAAAYNFSNMKLPNITYGGAATGPRYNSSSSLINTYGGGASYFPGSTAGISGQTNYA